MTIKQYAKKVRVHARTIRNDIYAKRIIPTIRVSERGPVLDINTDEYPPEDYKRRKKGRPKGAKNKPKTKMSKNLSHYVIEKVTK